MQVKCESCGAMFFIPSVKKGKAVPCRKCGAKIVAEPSKEAGARLATTIRKAPVNDMASETYLKMASDSATRKRTASEPGDKVVAWAIRIYGVLFSLGAVFGVVAMCGGGMDDWQGPAAVALIGLPIPALIPICSFAAFFSLRSKTKRLVHWLVRAEGTPPPDIDNPARAMDVWRVVYAVMGALCIVVFLLGGLSIAAEVERLRNSYFGASLRNELIGWQIGVLSGVLLIGIKNLLLSALFQGQARFAREVAELLREKGETEVGPPPDAVKAAAAAESVPAR